MALRAPRAGPLAIEGLIPVGKLFHQVPPFEIDLAAGHGNRRDIRYRPDLALIEGITAASRLGMDRGEIQIDRRAWCLVGTEAFELRVLPVALGLAAQHRFREQGFAPQGEQALAIEIARMQAPESHGIYRPPPDFRVFVGRGSAGVGVSYPISIS